MPVARSDQFTVYVEIDKAPNITVIFDTEPEAAAANAELVEAIEAARAGKRSIATFANGRTAIDAKRYVSSRVLPAMSTPGLSVEGVTI